MRWAAPPTGPEPWRTRALPGPPGRPSPGRRETRAAPARTTRSVLTSCCEDETHRRVRVNVYSAAGGQTFSCRAVIHGRSEWRTGWVGGGRLRRCCQNCLYVFVRKDEGKQRCPLPASLAAGSPPPPALRPDPPPPQCIKQSAGDVRGSRGGPA